MTLLRLTAAQRRGLSMLATAGRDGATLPLLAAHGVSAAVIGRLVEHGFATMTHGKVRAGAKMVEVGKVRITDAGREALAVEG